MIGRQRLSEIGRGEAMDFWRQDLRQRLEQGASRTPLSSRSGAVWLTQWAWACLLVALTLYIAEGYHAGFERINAAAALTPSWIWSGATVLGDTRVAFALALLFALRYPRLLWALILAALIAVAYSRGLKELVDATRPPGVLSAGDFHLIGPSHRKASFPSGHSVTAAAFFGTLVYFTQRASLRILFLGLAVLAGVSRIAVGVHWPLDVAAGLFGGALAAWIGAALAAHWSGPATRLGVHATVVVVASILALTLLIDDGGYPEAAIPLALLGLLALVVAAHDYLLRPLLRHRRSRRSIHAPS
jgi:membrane-associated phospholipid phosphatase